MTVRTFRQCVRDNETPPAGLSPILQSLWWAFNADWDKAHATAQAIPDELGSWIHANLHREEADLANAHYWYARANRHMPDNPVDEERNEILGVVLAG